MTSGTIWRTVAALLCICAVQTAQADGLGLRYPGDFWGRYDAGTSGDAYGGRLQMIARQGVELRRVTAFVGVDVYRPASGASDSYMTLGVKRRIFGGVEVGVERQFVFGGVNRSAAFAEYVGAWDFSK